MAAIQIPAVRTNDKTNLIISNWSVAAGKTKATLKAMRKQNLLVKGHFQGSIHQGSLILEMRLIRV